MRTHQQAHNAGRHLGVAEALMRGYNAVLVGRSSHIEVNGHKAQVQVAARGAWQIDDVDKYASGTIDHFVLVDVTDGLREFYVCPGDQLRRFVRTHHDQFVRSKGGTRPRNPDSRHFALYPEQVQARRNGWDRLA
jgi:hypothetical protein